MSDPFDPYYIWLGIPPQDQPPNHYRLLGIELFEANREVIEAAANRQMSYLQELSSGEEHIDEAQKLLGEVSRARVCLLNDEKKAAYDEQLREQIAAAKAEFVAEEFTGDSVTPAGGDLATEEPRAGEGKIPAFPGIAGGGPQTGKKPVVPPPDGLEASHTATARPRRKKQKLVPIIGLAIAAVVLFGGGLTFYLSSQAQQREKDRKGEIAKKQKEFNREAEEKADRIEAQRKAKEETERKAEEEAGKEKEEDAGKKKEEAERKAKEAEARKAKEEAERKAKQEQAKKAKQEAERKAKQEQARKAKEEAERKAKQEQARKAKEEAERKAKQEAERIAANPEELLKSKELQKKGKKWVLAVERPLQYKSKELQTDWKQWANAARSAKTPQDAKAVLARYGELFQKTHDYQAMRLAVAQEYERAATDPQILEALKKLGQKPQALTSASKQFGRPDAIMKTFSKARPRIGNFACLIINEKVPVVIHLDEKLLGEKDGPSLFILPRSSHAQAGLPIVAAPQKWMNNGYRAAMFETTVPSLRFGSARAQNITANFHPTPAEGGTPNGESTYGGKVGKAAWMAFFSQLKSAPPPVPTAQEITAARNELNRLLTASPNEKNWTP